MRMKGFIGVNDITEDKGLWKALVAEFIGTFTLVCVGIFSIVQFSLTANHAMIAFAFGLIVATMAQTLGHVSGCHINPAVTLGLLASGSTTLMRSICYIVIQLVGAIAGAGVAMLILPESMYSSSTLGVTNLGPTVEPASGFVVEAIITSMLVFVVHGIGDVPMTGSGPLAVGLSITAGHMAAIPLTGSSMNPARSFGPAVVMNFWDNHWVYWAGPITGGILAGLLYRIVFKSSKQGEAGSYDF